MHNTLDQIRARLAGVAEIYNRLVLLVGNSGSGRTTAIRELADAEGVPVVNVGVEISRRLLELTAKVNECARDFKWLRQFS